MIQVGDVFFCLSEVEPLLANRMYHVTRVGAQIELDGNPALVYSPVEIKEWFLPAPTIYQDLRFRTQGKAVKEKIHHLVPYFYFDPEMDRCYLAPELMQLFAETDDFPLMVRVTQLLLEAISSMTVEEVEYFYTLDWDEVWTKMGQVLTGELTA